MKAAELAEVFIKYPNNTKQLLDIVKKKKLDFLLPKALEFLNKKRIFTETQDEVLLETPFETSDEARASIESKFGLKIQKQKVNKDMIAGFRVYTKNKILDASLDGLLKQIIK